MDTAHVTPELFAALAKHGSYFLGSDKYPGYFVTPEGMVFSCQAKRFLKPMMCGKYHAVQLRSRSGQMVRRYIHRLVAELKTGAIPAGMDACHNDGDRFNNHESNIRWDSRAANHADKKAHGTCLSGDRNHMAKLRQSDVVAIRARVSAGETQRSLCKVFGVSPMTISRVVRKETWRG